MPRTLLNALHVIIHSMLEMAISGIIIRPIYIWENWGKNAKEFTKVHIVSGCTACWIGKKMIRQGSDSLPGDREQHNL